ncbi:hypothetical protein Q8F55_002945 [Vanrija albida]|uniref:Zn(2)-C6 fungal-type domain-containing protein n=1 Tax=Vanrija albida TaxID=181172 RepID=A0ABR3QBR5_9TREE
MPTASTPTATAPASPAAQAKRKRHTRTATGCRACRLARVKCPEGAVTRSGAKAACRRCTENGAACLYPARELGGRTPRKGMRERDAAWEAAAGVADGDGAPVPKRVRLDERGTTAPRAPLAKDTDADVYALPLVERGCVDSLCAPERHNPIWTLFALFALFARAVPMADERARRLHHGLRQLAYAANVDADELRCEEAARARRRADAELARASLAKATEDQDLTELLVRFMADRVPGGALDPGDTPPALSAMLRYATLQSAIARRASPADHDAPCAERFPFLPVLAALLARADALAADKAAHVPQTRACSLVDELSEAPDAHAAGQRAE